MTDTQRMPARHVRRFLILCWGFCFLFPDLARAQPWGKTVVVTFGAEREPALAAASEVEAQLARRRVSLISMHDARDRFTSRSRVPQRPSSSDLEILAKQAREAVQHVAFGRAADAERSVREIIALAERSLESLNRETQQARQLLDACLALVRSSLHEGQRERAIEQAMECRRLVPDLSPNQSSHPANVIGALAEADDQLGRMRAGNLSVRTLPPRPCSLYLNGRHLGTTPFVIDRAAAGTYRVQIECNEGTPGRVHVVQLGDRAVELEIDLALDRAVVTEPRLGLAYTPHEVPPATLVTHAVRLGRELRADDVVLVGVEHGQARLLRIDVEHERCAAGAVTTFEAIRGADGADPIDALAQGRFVGLSPSSLVPITTAPDRSAAPAGKAAEVPAGTAPDRSPPPPRRRLVRWKLWAGSGALALGVACEVAGWSIYGTRSKQGDELRQELSDLDNGPSAEWHDARSRMLALAAPGALLAGAGVVLIATSAPAERLPWWVASASGVVGTGLAAWGAVDLARGETCADQDARDCAEGEQRRDRGALLLMSAVPFAVLPVVKLARREKTREQPGMTIGATASLGQVRIAGSW